MLSYDIIQKLIFGNGNKVKLLRENRSMIIEELAKAANVTKEYLEDLEQNPIEQLTPDLAKIANTLEIDEELLLTSPLWLDDKDLNLFNDIKFRSFISQRVRARLSQLFITEKDTKCNYKCQADGNGQFVGWIKP